MKKPFVTLEQAKKIIETVKKNGAQVSGPVPLPTKKEVVTILRAVHKYKDSREQFEQRTHKRLIGKGNPHTRYLADFEGGGLRCGLLLLHRAAVGGCCWAKGRGYYVFLQRNPGGGFH